jgi:hypothetical protein
MKYTIKLVRGYWEIRDSKNRLVGLASTLERAKKVGPWRPAEIQCEWVGDAKKT